MPLRVAIALGFAMLALAACGSQPSHRPAASPVGTLYLAGRHPGTLTVLSLPSGKARTVRLRQLSPGDPQWAAAPIGGWLVVYGRDHTYAYGPGLREPPRDLGRSWFFVPSATAGRLWLVSLDPRHFRLSGVREVTAGGAVTLAHGRAPAHFPVGAVDGGLLFQDRTLEVWDPVRGTILRPLPGVFPAATHGSLVASCPPSCPRLHVTDARTGRDTPIAPPRGYRFVESYDGAFSPNGQLVAVQVTHAGQQRVALVDPTRHRTALVAGAALARDYPLIAWASSGWLFFKTPDGRHEGAHPVDVEDEAPLRHLDHTGVEDLAAGPGLLDARPAFGVRRLPRHALPLRSRCEQPGQQQGGAFLPPAPPGSAGCGVRASSPASHPPPSR